MEADWIAWFRGEHHLVVRFVMKNGASLEDASDAAEDAFEDAWALLRQQPAKWSQIRDRRGWIRAVALRKHRRPPGPRRRPLTSDTKIPDVAAPGLEPGELTAQTQAVLQALRGLDDPERAVMAFRTDGFPVADIADALQISEQKVRDVTKRARAALKRTLAQPLEGGNHD
jgi:RNA polymerase sigma factor (sigma-70 family)